MYSSPRTISSPAPPMPQQVRDLLGGAVRELLDARSASHATDRYAHAHLAALRTAAALLAAYARPAARRGTPRLRSAWSLLAEVAPDLSEWAVFFAAGAGKRVAAEAGLADSVSHRDADDLVRDVEAFLILVAARLGIPAPVSQQLILAS